MQTLEITRPDDWHIHLRDGEVLSHTVADASRYFGRVIVMPNLTPPVRNLAEATAYRQRIEQALPTTGHKLQPLMVLYLTDNTQPEDIAAAAASDVVYAAKLYPAGATTNSDSGVTSIEKLYPVLESMEKHGLPLLVHGEVTDAEIDIFDREAQFIDRYLRQICTHFPALKLVLEHITTADAAQFVSESADNVAATITAHHLLYNRNHMLAGGIRPHYYCLPILKRNTHQQALIAAATSGSPKFFLGTDSAPHARHRKEASCGCAGCYTAYAAIELYVEAFEAAGKLDKLEAFASFYGPDFYGLPRNNDTIILQKNSWIAPEQLPLGGDTIYPLRGGEQLHWQIA
ncbi:dihydroorotase [Zhongshania aliphaticivorans]|uniref:dihydroorotase n=1 Tax=Zhongshania aliphaticivorans TaxID=1470434 RepID=UPI0012E48730|nr:dihydroorotase [Zhongshania aliphaticivorans]CAA0095070.1 Dihydroorotase [Zhongshania aliphaticivorans]